MPEDDSIDRCARPSVSHRHDPSRRCRQISGRAGQQPKPYTEHEKNGNRKCHFSEQDSDFRCVILFYKTDARFPIIETDPFMEGCLPAKVIVLHDLTP